MKGKVLRGYVFCCAVCGGIEIFYSPDGHIDLATAERWARRSGWTKTRRRWAHKKCVRSNDNGGGSSLDVL